MIAEISAYLGCPWDNRLPGGRLCYYQVMTATDSPPSLHTKPALFFLGLPTFALAFAITLTTAFVPVIVAQFTESRTLIGLLVGGEGLFALFLPLVIGSWSDHQRGSRGPRIPFMLAATPLVIGALIAMAFSDSLWLMAVNVAIFYAGYFSYYPPYNALYPDLVSADHYGRAQSVQAIFRAAALGCALTGGGFLLDWWQPLPFIVAAALFLIITLVFVGHLKTSPAIRNPAPRQFGVAARELWRLVRGGRELRYILVANMLWEFSLAAIKTFAILYITVGIGKDLSFASLTIGAVALVCIVAALISGSIADRYGRRRVVLWSLSAYGISLFVPLLTQDAMYLLPALPFLAIGGAVVMTLPYALVMDVMPDTQRGTVAGLYSMSRGLGLCLGPLIAGMAIDFFRPVFPATLGYSAVWLVAALAILLSIPFIYLSGRSKHEEALPGQ